MHIKTANEVRRIKAGLRSPQALGGGIKRPVQRRLSHAPIHTGKLDSGGVEDRYQVAAVRALKILIARGERIERKPFQGLGEKGDRLYLGIDGLSKVFSKSQPEDKRAEIVQRRHAPDVVGEDRLRVQLNIFTALVLL